MKKTAAKASILPERFVDTGIFLIGLAAYEEVLTSRAREPSQDPLFIQGVKVAKRYAAATTEGVKLFLEPLTGLSPEDKPGEDAEATALRAAVRQGQIGSGEKLIANQVRMFVRVFTWLGRNTNVVNDVFPNAKAQKNARLALLAMRQEDPAARLHKCASIPTVSAFTGPQGWLKEAAAGVKMPLSATEAVVRDAETVANIGDNLSEIRGKLATATPNSQEEADLQDQEAAALRKIDVAASKSPDPSAVLAAAAVAATAKRDNYRTAVGKQLGHTPEQEDAMMVQGRAIIAAGAGSGKTRVLASKVAWHINEKGVKAAQILATSFTRKSAAELLRRVKDYGAVIEGPAADNFGTTHSIAGKILNNRAPNFRRSGGYLGKDESWKQTILIRLAMEQVQMPKSGMVPPPPQGLWAKLFRSDTSGEISHGISASEFIQAIDNALGYYQWAARTWSGGPADWARRTVSFLEDFRTRDPNKLSENQRSALNNIFSKVKGRSPVHLRVAGLTDDGLSAPGKSPGDTMISVASDKKDEKKKGRKNDLSKYQYFKTPARQWFNLGLELLDDNGAPLPAGRFKNAISIMKGRGQSPSEAWAEEESPEAAVYAAYEWLKSSSGETEFQGKGDMDDILIDTVSALVGDPNLRKQIQAQFKVLLVDEAQDLNRVQHLIFGLMSGYLDAATLKPKPDKSMTADTFAYIGDDKQSIYEFRGADPNEFIEKSDLRPGGDNFKTKLLDINFRSGSAIVNAANQLIAHNKKQIPMVCKTVPAKGMGSIRSLTVGSAVEAAATVASRITEMVESHVVPIHDTKKGQGGYASFGLALRSNREAYTYGLELIKRGIPFKANKNFFTDPGTKALIGWMTLVEKGTSADEHANEAVLDATYAPSSRLGRDTLEEKLETAVGNGSFVEYLLKPEAKRLYSGQWAEHIQVFIGNVKDALEFKGSPEEILDQILNLKGVDDLTVREAMIERVRDDSEAMAELSAESSDGTVTDEQIEAMALAPIAPLLGLVKDREDLTGAMAYVRRLKNVNAKISSKDTEKEIDRDAVTIGTVHSWKGLEVPHLFVPMEGAKFPSLRADIESERRLAYVAMTRAEESCTVFDIPTVVTGPGGKPFIIRSQFIDEACLRRAEGPRGPDLGAEAEIAEIEGSHMASLKTEWGPPLSEPATEPDALEKDWGEVL